MASLVLTLGFWSGDLSPPPPPPSPAPHHGSVHDPPRQTSCGRWTRWGGWRGSRDRGAAPRKDTQAPALLSASCPDWKLVPGIPSPGVRKNEGIFFLDFPFIPRPTCGWIQWRWGRLRRSIIQCLKTFKLYNEQDNSRNGKSKVGQTDNLHWVHLAAFFNWHLCGADVAFNQPHTHISLNPPKLKLVPQQIQIHLYITINTLWESVQRKIKKANRNIKGIWHLGSDHRIDHSVRAWQACWCWPYQPCLLALNLKWLELLWPHCHRATGGNEMATKLLFCKVFGLSLDNNCGISPAQAPE